MKQVPVNSTLRRWAPIALIIPLCYILSPLLWVRIDYRFYNFFASKRPSPTWEHVAVVEIDEATVRGVFDGAVYPLSRHAGEHARLVAALDSAGARAVVLDLRLSADEFESTPTALADAMKKSGNVYLVTSFTVRGHGDDTYVGVESSPHPVLQRAAKGIFVANMLVDPDGVLRRVAPIPEATPLGLETLSEALAGRVLERPTPIEFPSAESPVPALSYADVLRDPAACRATLENRIVYVGSVLDEATDHVLIPRSRGRTFLLPGVQALAAATETLLDGAPIRDAGRGATLGWNLLWSILAVAAVRRYRPYLSAFLIGLVIAAALTVTGVLHAAAGLVFPAGLLLGCVLVSGTYALSDMHQQTTRELYSVLKQSHDELEDKVRVRTAELTAALDTVRATQAQLVQSEKMASLGGLVAGVAHEINNPVGAVNAALDVSRRCAEKIDRALDDNGVPREPFQKSIAIIKESTASAQMASERIALIVRSLKNFARLDEAEYQEADIHEGIESALALLDHELEGRIEVVREFSDIPRVHCYVRELNQAFMNILRNAMECIDGAGQIAIATSVESRCARVTIADTGAGIAEDVLPRIFDPGFTTRGVGVGTGLGLSIAYNIVHKHGGEILVSSVLGQGTRVTIDLPLEAGGEPRR